jgi:hypothetical protein
MPENGSWHCGTRTRAAGLPRQNPLTPVTLHRTTARFPSSRARRVVAPSSYLCRAMIPVNELCLRSTATTRRSERKPYSISGCTYPQIGTKCFHSTRPVLLREQNERRLISGSADCGAAYHADRLDATILAVSCVFNGQGCHHRWSANHAPPPSPLSRRSGVWQPAAGWDRPKHSRFASTSCKRSCRVKKTPRSTCRPPPLYTHCVPRLAKEVSPEQRIAWVPRLISAADEQLGTTRARVRCSYGAVGLVAVSPHRLSERASLLSPRALFSRETRVAVRLSDGPRRPRR